MYMSNIVCHCQIIKQSPKNQLKKHATTKYRNYINSQLMDTWWNMTDHQTIHFHGMFLSLLIILQLYLWLILPKLFFAVLDTSNLAKDDGGGDYAWKIGDFGFRTKRDEATINKDIALYVHLSRALSLLYLVLFIMRIFRTTIFF
jgi:hypothetical protein